MASSANPPAKDMQTATGLTEQQDDPRVAVPLEIPPKGKPPKDGGTQDPVNDCSSEPCTCPPMEEKPNCEACACVGCTGQHCDHKPLPQSPQLDIPSELGELDEHNLLEDDVPSNNPAAFNDIYLMPVESIYFYALDNGNEEHAIITLPDASEVDVFEELFGFSDSTLSSISFDDYSEDDGTNFLPIFDDDSDYAPQSTGTNASAPDNDVNLELLHTPTITLSYSSDPSLIRSGGHRLNSVRLVRTPRSLPRIVSQNNLLPPHYMPGPANNAAREGRRRSMWPELPTVPPTPHQSRASSPAMSESGVDREEKDWRPVAFVKELAARDHYVALTIFLIFFCAIFGSVLTLFCTVPALVMALKAQRASKNQDHDLAEKLDGNTTSLNAIAVSMVFFFLAILICVALFMA